MPMPPIDFAEPHSNVPTWTLSFSIAQDIQKPQGAERGG